jgi:hypothetical protein
MVERKDGAMRMCVDFRRLNSVTTPDAYPMPVLTDVLSRMNGAKFLSVVDCASGFFQISIRPEDRHKTAFQCTHGLFEYNVMPFGSTNAPSVWMRNMDQALRGLGHFAVAFMDDIAIWSATFDDHLRDLQAVFDRISHAGLTLKLSKCVFFASSVVYLGHRLTPDGIGLDAERVRRVAELPRPTTADGVRRFVATLSWNRRFIKDFAHISKPLVDGDLQYGAFISISFCFIIICIHSYFYLLIATSP